MKIYSNKHLSVVERLRLWRMFEFPRIGLNHNDAVFKVIGLSKNELSFVNANRYTMPPLGFVTQFVWEHPDKQIGVTSLDLKTYDLCGYGRLYQKALQIPEDIKEGDLVYVDTKKLMYYALV